MTLKTLFIWIFTSVTSLSFSQETAQEVFKAEITYTQEMIDTIISHHLRNIKPLKNASELKKMLESNDQLSGWVHYNFFKAAEFTVEKEYDSVVKYADRAIQSYENSKSKRDFEEERLFYSYYLKGRSLAYLQKFEQAILSHQMALEYTKKYPYKWKSFIVSAIANSHLEIGNDSIALDYYLKISKDSLYMSIDRSSVTTYTRIGTIYYDFEDLESSRKYYQKAIDKSENGKYKSNMWILYNNIGDIYKKKNNIDSTLFYYKKAINYYDDAIQSSTGTNNLFNYLKGYIELYEGDINQSIYYFNEVIAYFKEKPISNKDRKDLLVQVYAALGDAYGKTNNTEGLKTTLESSNKLIENFYQHQLEVNLNDLELKYQTKEKDDSIKLLEITTENQEVIIKQRSIINWVLGGLLLSFVSLGFLFYRQRQLQNRYKASNLEQRLLRSQLNPHFLFNALNSVSGLVYKKSDQAIPYISKLGNLLRSILENSREEFISLKEELETINTYLELQSNFSKKFAFNIHVDENLDQEGLLIPPMFLQPFVENAIDHGFKGAEGEKIIITIIQNLKDQVLYFSIEDNGIGYSKAIKDREYELGHKSLSGTILKERLDIYARTFNKKARCIIKDKDTGSGTKVELWLPYLMED
ncbi:histidine kinase [Dokdonia ponticola]|uniref:Histidine kinase n=1 Tax=Dokdonia ponticola TaxID=2041041 RepID=A0ABV9HYE7_9FLAO